MCADYIEILFTSSLVNLNTQKFEKLVINNYLKIRVKTEGDFKIISFFYKMKSYLSPTNNNYLLQFCELFICIKNSINTLSLSRDNLVNLVKSKADGLRL